ncbi:class I SAM-dependent methyltransferase [Streptomyces spinoverrucosus]|uniref:class I SAM-dependent methyltransferase n=1 Tax=Streptomyces spinoverrucosus TaxID=284043 RepID=UPI0018C3A55F|nr:class I SAM-dependent methyltransferase [Streptomyces spinoverrucosus]MBG0851360.1 class I SAM-dependent methyltransferase [Streptomyces spinoverrucosus]
MAQQPQGPTAEELAARTPGEFWESLYSERADGGAAWGDRVNPVLAEVAGVLPPGLALDLACGTGGDTLWLAARGWRVTAVDISPTAVDRLGDVARSQRMGELVTAECHDLARTFPAGEFDLVSAQYFHTPYDLPRGAILRTAAEALRPGGRLLVVDHGSLAPWSWKLDQEPCFPTPEEVYADIGLPAAGWAVERSDARDRRATGPGGQTATVTDHVLLVRRATG